MKRRSVISVVTALGVALLVSVLTTGVGLAAHQPPSQAPVDKFAKSVLPGSEPWVNGIIHYQIELHLNATAAGDVVLKDDFLNGIDFLPFGGANGNFKVNGVPVTTGPSSAPNPKLASSMPSRKVYEFWLGENMAPGTAIITFDAKVGPSANPWQYVSNSASLHVRGAWKASSKVSTDLSETVSLFPKDPSSWEPLSGGASGKLKYVFGGPTFRFIFSASKLNPNTNYSLIYYAEGWPGNHPGALIASGTSNSAGKISLNGSRQLGFSLPAPADGNFSKGAMIWLVLSKDYNSSTYAMKGWNMAKYLFDTKMIKYVYAP